VARTTEIVEQVSRPDLVATTERWVAAAQGLAPYDLEHRIRAADVTFRWFKTGGSPVRGAAGWTIKSTCRGRSKQQRSDRNRRRRFN